MKKLLLCLPITVALITACGQGNVVPPAATLSTLTLSGVTGPLQISVPAQLTVTATGSDGKPFSGTPTFTSSDPNVVAVDANGGLQVRHLSASPVTLSVSEGGKTAILTTTTYGLDATGGTLKYDSGLGTDVFLAFRDSAGNALTSDTSVNVQGPAGFNQNKPVTYTLPKGTTVSDYLFYASTMRAPVTGAYTATLIQNGTTFTKTFNLDASQILPPLTSVTVTSDASKYALSGTLPVGVASVQLEIVDAQNQTVRVGNLLKSLPYGATWNVALPSGSYSNLLIAYSVDTDASLSFPDQLNTGFASSPLNVP